MVSSRIVKHGHETNAHKGYCAKMNTLTLRELARNTTTAYLRASVTCAREDIDSACASADRLAISYAGVPLVCGDEVVGIDYVDDV